MAENTKPVQARDPFDRFDEAISDPRLYEADQSRYQQLREQLRYEPQTQYEQPQYEPPQYEQPFALSVEPPEELPPHEPVPLFLANYEEEHHQQLSEYAFASGSRRFGSGGLKKARAGRIVTGVVVVSAIAAVLALFSIDSTRAVIFNASLGGGGGGSAPPPAQLAAAVPEPAQRSIAAPPLAAEPTGAEVAAARRTPPNALASASPTRDEIAAAYQSALKGKVGVPEPVARDAAREVAPLAPAPAAPVVAVAPAVRDPVTREAAPARRIDPDELEALLKRAKSLLAIGDITSARLLLERAADAQEAEAALMLAGTYDPQVLGSQDMRSVAPDAAAAKIWYQKAAQLGSADAQRRLGQLQN
jgi:TPR repeat protein